MASASVETLRGSVEGRPPACARSQAPDAPQSFAFFDKVLAGMVGAGQGIEALCLLFGLTPLALAEHIVRLCLPTPHDRPLRKPGPRGWSIRDKIRLIYWRLRCVHPEIIGQCLEKPRSANAVRAQSRRLGIPTPPRHTLHKPDPASLPEPDLPSFFGLRRSACREPALPETPDATKPAAATAASTGSGVRDILRPVLGGEGRKAQGSATASAPRRGGKRRDGRRVKAAGQRELRLLVVVGGTDTPSPEQAKGRETGAAPALPPIPATEEEVDFSGDLTWFRRLAWKNPLTCRVAVWTFFMLIAGGLHYKAAGERLGISEGAFRSIRSRMGVPVDFDRRKAGAVFDEEAARVTLERSGYVLRQCIKSPNWFWVEKSDRGTRLSPPYRSGERIPGQRSNRFTIITRAMFESERCIHREPFAASAVRVSA